jgi:uncharacterized protein (DUF1330 family)
MPKGYWIAHVDVIDLEGYNTYMEAALPLIGKAGGRFLVRGGNNEKPEGAIRARSVVIEFPSYEAALALYHSPDYEAAAAHRMGRAKFDLIIVEGYEDAQP